MKATDTYHEHSLRHSNRSEIPFQCMSLDPSLRSLRVTVLFIFIVSSACVGNLRRI
mgnify:CR=1 FL=1